MKKEYKEYVINRLYGLMEGSIDVIEYVLNNPQYNPLGIKPGCIKITTTNKRSESKSSMSIGAMSFTITIDNEEFTVTRDFDEEYLIDKAHPDEKTDDWFYESDKCYSSIKCKELLASLN